MKKLFLFICVLIASASAFAKCGFFDRTACPTTDCPQGTFMGDDGKCYGCDEEAKVGVNCIREEKASKVCPNRVVTWVCGATSKLCPKVNCPQGTFMGDDGKCYACDETEEISVDCLGVEMIGKLCPNRGITSVGTAIRSHKCPPGYNNQKGHCCKGNDCFITVVDL